MHGALINSALSFAVIFEEEVVISNLWNAEGWDVELLLSVLPRETVNLIVNVPTGFSESGDDTRIWKILAGSVFSFSSAGLYGSGETSKFLNQGLKLAVNLNIKNLIIESDSAILVQLMNNFEFGNHPLGSLRRWRVPPYLISSENATLLLIP
ncbi:hypothetical protein ACLB2K_061195 [Fragaria x ananassa]